MRAWLTIQGNEDLHLCGRCYYSYSYSPLLRRSFWPHGFPPDVHSNLRGFRVLAVYVNCRSFELVGIL